MTTYESVRAGRRAVQDALSAAHEAVTKIILAPLYDVHDRIHEAQEATKGQKGMSQQEQANLLDMLVAALDGALGEVPVLVQNLTAATQQLSDSLTASLTEAKEAATATQALAATRDFETWQQIKPPPVEDDLPTTPEGMKAFLANLLGVSPEEITFFEIPPEESGN